MDSQMSGFSEEQIQLSLRKLQESYDSLYAAMCTQFQNEFVAPVSESWACQEAQQFFTSVETVMNAIYKDTTAVFSNICQTIDNAAMNWAVNTRSNYNRTEFVGQTTMLDVSAVQENIDGYRGADERDLEDSIQALQKINSEVDSNLDIAVNAVADCGLSDQYGEQQAALDSSLRKIKQQIDSTMDEIINVFKNAINATITKYGGIISKNSIDFSKIAGTPADAANGNFIAEDNILKDYWLDDDENKIKVVVNEDGTTTYYQVGPDGTETPMGASVPDGMALQGDASSSLSVVGTTSDAVAVSAGALAGLGAASTSNTATDSESNSGSGSGSGEGSESTAQNAEQQPAEQATEEKYDHGWGGKYAETWTSWWGDVKEAYSDTHGFFSAVGNTVEAVLDTGGAVVETVGNFVSDVAHGIGNVVGWLFG
jgi:hypothetical protein